MDAITFASIIGDKGDVSSLKSCFEKTKKFFVEKAPNTDQMENETKYVFMFHVYVSIDV